MWSESLTDALTTRVFWRMDAIDCCLLVLLAVASVTDVRAHRIPNWLTYPGMLLGVALHFAASGWEGFAFSAAGWFACGFLMLVCFVFFDLGGGDVKLLAMAGAFWGVHAGIELLLWTCVLGAACGIVWIIWSQGALRLAGRAVEHARVVVKAGGWVPLEDEDREPLKRWLFLAPSCLLGMLVMLAFR